MSKRTLDSVTLPSSKKQKVEVAVHSPFAIDAMIKEIGKYFEGDHIINFKLVCKRINSAMKDIKPEPMEITPDNYERISKVPGHHFMKMGKWVDTTALLEILQLFKPNEITNLLVDYCGEKVSYSFRPPEILSRFRSLRSFKVIRCADYFVMEVGSKYDNLNTLEIYSSNYMTLYLYKEVENIRLYSGEISTGPPTIEIKTLENLMEYAKKVPCYGDFRYVRNSRNGEIVDAKQSPEDFVPNPKFL